MFLSGADALVRIVPKQLRETDRQGVLRDGFAASAVDRRLLRSWVHDSGVNGAQFSRDESRVLTWSYDNTARLWDATDPLAMLNPAERILELEVRSGATLDTQLNLRTLKFDEWQAKLKSPEYRAIEAKLANRTAKMENQTESSNGIPASETKTELPTLNSAPTADPAPSEAILPPIHLQNQPALADLSRDRHSSQRTSHPSAAKSHGSPSLLLTIASLAAVIVILALTATRKNTAGKSP